MSRSRPIGDNRLGEQTGDWLLWGAAALLVVVPPALATDFGGNLPWSQYVASLALVLACGMAAVAQTYLLSRGWFGGDNHSDQPQVLAFTFSGLLLLLMGYALLQTLALSPDWVRAFSPGSHHVRYAWAAELNPTAVRDSFPVSVAPFDSAHSVALLAVALVVSYFSPIVFRDRARTTALLTGIAAGGCSIALLGILRKVDPNFTLWSFQSGGEGAPFGTFLNRNNAALGINIGIAGSLGVLVWRKTITASLRKDVAATERSKRESGAWLNDWPLLAALAATSIGLLGVVACGSRGGLLTTFLAGGITLAVVRRSIGSLRGVILVIAAFGALAFLILRTDSLGYQSLQGDAFSELRDTVEGDRDKFSSRLSHWPDGLRAAGQYFPAGSGLGTYGYAYLPWQKTSQWRWYVHADNLWLEALVELGLFGAVLTVACLWLLGRNLWLLSRSADPMDQGLLATGCYLFVAILFSQCFDFGLIMPANLFVVMIVLPMIFCRGASVVLPKTSSDNSKPRRKLELLNEPSPIWGSASLLRQRVVPIVGIIGLIAVATPAMIRLREDCESDGALRFAKKELPGLRFDATNLEKEIVALEELATRSPNPQLSDLLARYRFQLGRLNEFDSLRATTRWSDSTTELYEMLSFEERRLAWRASSDRHRPAMERTGKTWPAIPLSGDARREDSHYRKALTWSRDSLRQCPLSIRVRDDHLRLEFVHASKDQTRTSIVQAANLFPNNAKLSLRFGQRAADHGDYATAASLWKRAATVHPPMIKRILSRSLALEGFPVASIVPNNPLTRKTVQQYLRERGLESALQRPPTP
ncbi:MAG: O-antigen ligase family protein [Planctomycetota bacterium]